jgi:hypothetical protein
VLFLPDNGEPRASVRNAEYDDMAQDLVSCYSEATNKFTYHSGFSLTESDLSDLSP